MPREVRPRFVVETEESAETLLRRVSTRLRTPGCTLCGVVADGRIELYVPAARQRLWSAELRVEVQAGERGASLSGIYRPHPHVWMAYAAILALVLVATVAALTFALAEWMIHEPPVALHALLPLAILGGVTYSLAFVGQGLASDEMDELRAFLDDVVFSSVPVASGVHCRVPAEDDTAGRRAG